MYVATYNPVAQAVYVPGGTITSNGAAETAGAGTELADDTAVEIERAEDRAEVIDCAIAYGGTACGGGEPAERYSRSLRRV
jgi:hypothetical protein